MTTWHRLDLGNGQDAFSPTNQIQEAVHASMLADPSNSEIALFSRYDLLKDNVEIYFTPEAITVARVFGACPCEKPAPGRFRMGLLVGSAGSLSRHFPDQPPP